MFPNLQAVRFVGAQAQLVYEGGQLKASIAMTHPDRIHTGKPADRAHRLCYGGTHGNKTAEHLLEMVRWRLAELRRWHTRQCTTSEQRRAWLLQLVRHLAAETCLEGQPLSCTCPAVSPCLGCGLLTRHMFDNVQIRIIHLSDEQTNIVLRLRKLYLQNLGILVRRRQDLSSMLQVMP